MFASALRKLQKFELMSIAHSRQHSCNFVQFNFKFSKQFHITGKVESDHEAGLNFRCVVKWNHLRNRFLFGTGSKPLVPHG